MKYLPYMMFLLVAVCCTAQRENDVWYFGESAGISFATGTPVAIGGPLSTQEGTATRSDPVTGALLFTTDGKTVYNRNFAPMPNGFGMLGGWSSTQSAIIVPFPESPTKYYVFTPGDLSNGNLNVYGLHYSIVDMSANGGEGDVIVKNVKLLDTCAEKLTATPHCNGTAFWVVTHDRMLPRFYMYRITAAGVDPPVVSDVGAAYTNPDNRNPGGNYGLGMIKFSASGELLAMTNPHSEMCEVFDVDLRTGRITNARVVDSMRPFYGVSFSPNESLLYATTWNEVLQYRLGASPIPSSRVNLGPIPSSSGNDYRGGIQRGPDDVIYVADGPRLQRIRFPDVAGPGCNYATSAGVPLISGTRALIGLPNIVEAQLRKTPPQACAIPTASFVADTTVCTGACVTFTNASSQNSEQFRWTFSGGTPNTHVGATPPPVCFAAAGRYTITLVAENVLGADTITRILSVYNQPQVSAGSDVTVCGFGAVALSASGAVRYVWSPGTNLSDSTSATPLFTSLASSTTLIVTGWNAAECFASDTITITRGDIVLSATPDTAVCLGASLTLRASGAAAYRWWSTADSLEFVGDRFTVEPVVRTQYFVEAITDVCIDTATVTVDVLPLPTLSTDDVIVCADSEAVMTAVSDGSITWHDVDGTLLHAGSEYRTRASTSSRTFIVRAHSAAGCITPDTVLLSTLAGTMRVQLGSGSGVAGGTVTTNVQTTANQFPMQITLAPTAPTATLTSVEPGRVVNDGTDGNAVVFEIDSSTALLSWSLFLSSTQRLALSITNTTSTRACVDVELTDGSIDLDGCAIQVRSVTLSNGPIALQIYTLHAQLVLECEVTSKDDLTLIKGLPKGLYLARCSRGCTFSQLILVD